MSSAKIQSPHRLIALALFVLCIWALNVQWERARSRLTASRVLLQVEVQMAGQLQQGGVSPQGLRANIELLRRVHDDELDAADFAIPLAIGSHYLLLENADSAIRWYERALELETRPEILVNLARAHELAGRQEESDRYLEQARDLDPLHYESVVRAQRRKRKGVPSS